MVKNLPANPRDMGSIPRLGRSPREGNDNRLQYSCLRNPIERGAWRATVHGVQRAGHNGAHAHQSAIPWPSRIHWKEKVHPHTIQHSSGSYRVIRHLLMSVTTSPRRPTWLLHPGITVSSSHHAIPLFWRCVCTFPAHSWKLLHSQCPHLDGRL